jgi:putative phosphoesterase
MSRSKRWHFGLISDLHGNLVALQAALAALKKLGVDQYLCMGDVATSGPNPAETVAALRDLHPPVVMGNTDVWALDPYPFAYRNEETPIIYEIELWGAQQLSEADRAFLSTFTPTVTLEMGATTVLCYHGSPRSNLEDIRATTPDRELDAIFVNHSATVAIGGHTHTQMVRRYHEMLMVNPGSVGAPVALARGETKAYYPPWTEFGLLEVTDTRQGPTLQVQLHRTPIDVEAVIAAANASGMPHVEWYIARWQRGNKITAP